MSATPKNCERVRKLRRELGLTQEQFADIVGVSRNYIGMIENGREPSDTFMLLVSSIEEKGVPGQSTKVSEEPSSYAKLLRTIPMLSWAHAGEAVAYEQLPESWQPRVPCTNNDPKAFAVAIEGDSMEPKFSSGDVVVLLPSSEPRNGDLVIAKLSDDGVLFKIFQSNNTAQTITLASYNPVYPAQTFKGSDFHWIYPVDSVVKKIRR